MSYLSDAQEKEFKAILSKVCIQSVDRMFADDDIDGLVGFANGKSDREELIKSM